VHKLFLCLRYLRKRRIAFFGIAAVALCVALLIVTTSLFSGFIDSYLTHANRILGEIVLMPSAEIAEYDTLVEHLESYPEVEHAQAVLRTGALLYLAKGDVRAVELVGIDLAQHSKEEYFRKGLLLQSEKEDPNFAISKEALATAREYLEKKYRRALRESELPVGAVLGIGIVAEPDELTDEYDREAILAEIRKQTRPMVITTGKVSSGDEEASAQKVTRTCWCVDVIQTGMHDADTRYVYLPLDFVKEIIGTKGEDGRFRCRGQVQITTSQDLDAKQVKSWLLTKDDILDPTRWVVILLRSEDTFTQYLRSELSEKTLRRIKEYEEESPVSDELMESLIADLNRILQDKKIYDTDIVDSLYLSSEANELIDIYKSRGFWSRLRHSVFGDYQDINRILLEDAYPLEIKRKLVLRRIEQAWWDFARDHWETRIPYAGIFVSTENPGVQAFTGEIRKQRMIIVSILGLIGLVAALLIFVILFMIVLQKRRDIGVLRSLGSSRGSVAQVFVWFGAGIGVIGSGLGLALGIWATKNISLIEALLVKLFGFKYWKSGVYFFSEIPNTVDQNWAVIIVIGGIVTAILGALVPALRASRVQPVEALRYE